MCVAGNKKSFFQNDKRQGSLKTLCVTGGNGLLGQKLIEQASQKCAVLAVDIQEGPSAKCSFVEYVRCDITDAELVEETLQKAKPDCVIHTAAFTDVDGCESHREEAWNINVRGTENIARTCRNLGIPMVHLSTDYVFDGNSGPYGEEAVPNPISFYGKTKLESERIVQSISNDSVIVRTMVLYGYSPSVRENFVTWLVRKLRNREAVSVVTDQYGNPTLADDLARALLLLVERGAKGLYHVAGGEWMNRFDFAVRVAEIFHLDRALIAPTTSGMFQQKAPRPMRSGLKTNKIKREYGIILKSVSEGLLEIRNQMDGRNGKDLTF